MQRIRQRRQNWRKIAISIVVLAVLVGIAMAGYILVTRTYSPLPTDVRQKLTFSPFILPTNAKNYSTSDYKFGATENDVQILSYIIRTENGVGITVSEYTQPQEFVELPEYKERFLNNIAKQYATVQTSNGTIYLGRMTRQSNKQLAIVLERGLVVFLNPDEELSETEWRNLGDQLEIQKIIR